MLGWRRSFASGGGLKTRSEGEVFGGDVELSREHAGSAGGVETLSGNAGSNDRGTLARSGAFARLAAVLAVLFLLWSLGLGLGYLATFDYTVADWAHAHESPALTSLMLVATFLGSVWVLVPLGLVALGWATRAACRRAAGGGSASAGSAAIVAALTGAWILFSLLKALFHRARPELFRLATAGGFSYPSGHSTSSVAFYLVAAYVIGTALGEKAGAPRRRAALVAIGAALALVIGFSRIYLGVHWASDVLGGWLAGGAWAALCLARYERACRGRPGSAARTRYGR